MHMVFFFFRFCRDYARKFHQISENSTNFNSVGQKLIITRDFLILAYFFINFTSIWSGNLAQGSWWIATEGPNENAHNTPENSETNRKSNGSGVLSHEQWKKFKIPLNEFSRYFISLLFCILTFVSDMPLMSQIQKTSLDPVKFEPDPDPGLGACIGRLA